MSEELNREFVRAIGEWRDHPVQMDLLTLIAIIGCTQLGLRHPGNKGPTAEHVEGALEAIIDSLERGGVPSSIITVLRLGMDPAQDVPP